MATLYRKYRPNNFSEVFGQKSIKKSIENQIKADNISHAYLFCGPRAIGKTTLARIFSKAINCLNRKDGESEPCGKCERCIEISQGKNLDIIEIDGASNNSIDNVRENIIAGSFVPPSVCKYKVFIIDEVHMLSIPAFNALLKILEEPPENIVFILCTTELQKMPNTIVSRCQRFDFKKIGIKEVIKKLEYIVKSENIEIEPAVLESIARQSDGHMRDAESILDQIISISDKKITAKEADLVLPRSDINEVINLILLLSKNNISDAIVLINNLVDNGVDLNSFVNDLINILRKIMIAKINMELLERIGVELGESLEIKFNKCVKSLELNKIVNIVNKFSIAKNELKNNFIIQLPIEVAIIELCGLEPIKNNTTQNIPVSTPDVSKISSVVNVPDIPVNETNKTEETSEIKKVDDSFSENVSKSVEMENEIPIERPVESGTDIEKKKKVVSEWSNIIEKVKKFYPSLNMILRSCKISRVQNESLIISFSHQFHYKSFSNLEVRTKIEEVIFEVCGYKLKIDTILEEGKKDDNSGKDKNIGEVDNMEKEGSENKDKDEASKEDKAFLGDVLDIFDGTVI